MDRRASQLSAPAAAGGERSSPVVRPAVPDDVALLAAIEVAAGARFRAVGMDAIADDEPLPDDLLRAARDEGRLWVAELDGVVVGYALGERVGPAGAQHHLEQVSVVPEAGGHGVGAALVEAVVDWARSAGGGSLTLATFRDLPWNAPWYERLGFAIVADDALDDALRTVRDHEAAVGLDVSARVCMRRVL